MWKTTTNIIKREVTSLFNEILDKVLSNLTPKVNTEKVENRKGAVKRKSYDNSFKMTVINECKRSKNSDQDIGVKFGIEPYIWNLYES